ncbi:MAG: PaaI family thioesterase [Hyphomicrobiales bacterium]|nr:PaaI family thioesterase [Hyphomicrobiales bacterium]MCP5373909.1 PaaI family thioesterase [Hyphomicrobiales bacterium]
MSAYEPRRPDFEQAVRTSFGKQGMMRHIRASVAKVEPGFCEIHLPYSDDVSQQHGFFHGGVVGTIADNAGGYAAFSLMADGDGILSVEYKLNITAPADGELLIARGRVVRPGRTLSVTTAEVTVVKDGKESVCAIMQQTLMRIIGNPNVVG